jgi:hypothetical protein
MNSIYIAHTPYHILISCGLAISNDNSEGKYLIIISDFENSHFYYQAISNWEKNPFTEIKLLPGRFNSKVETNMGKAKFLINNVITLKRFFKNKLAFKLCRAFIFNDNRPEGQVISFMNSKQDGINIYVEDGSAAYVSYIIPSISNNEKILAKCLLGRWYEQTRILGTYKCINQIMVFRPEIIREELRCKKIEKIPDFIFNEIDVNFINILLENYDINSEELKFDCIVILPHSEFITQLDIQIFKNTYNKLYSLLKENFKFIGIKYHPLEMNKNILENINNKKNKDIPNSLPLEIFWLALKKNPPKVIIGDISTALLTCSLIIQEKTQIISTVKILGLPESYSQFYHIFEKLDIEMPETSTDLFTYLQRICY